MHVAQGLVKVFGLLLRRHPINPCGTRRARLTVRFPQKVCLNQVGQGREHPVRIVGGLRRKALALWWAGWCSQRLSRRSVQLHVLPGVAFPPVGPLGLSSPPSPVLCSAQTATLPIAGRFACRSLPDTLPASVRSCCPIRARDLGEAPKPRQGFWSPGPPFRECDKETRGSPKFPSYPCGCMPRS